MKGYIACTNVREDAALRASFNELTRKTFGFDFTGWYEAGHWGKMYIPHLLLDGDKAVSNASVNLMRFCVNGERKNYIQLGTVMTDPDYRGLGLNRRIMEDILREYAGKVDGIYLFGNDSVLDYYPRFGFEPAHEYEYFLPAAAFGAQPYRAARATRAEVYALLERGVPSAEDGLYMDENVGLYQFWLDGEFGEQIYCLPEAGVYAVAGMEGKALRVYQLFGSGRIDFHRLAGTFGENAEEMVLGFTPAHPEGLLSREHKRADCTLFIIGDDLRRIERDRMMFPELSHA